jgi:RNA polymerase I-specific transcription initiation factor RRN3
VVQTTWVRNMCELIGYCPELGARIWSEVVDRMLRIDVSSRFLVNKHQTDPSGRDQQQPRRRGGR